MERAEKEFDWGTLDPVRGTEFSSDSETSGPLVSNSERNGAPSTGRRSIGARC